MNYLGISNNISAGVAGISSGTVVFAASEERLTRVKNDSGIPRRSLAALLEYSATVMRDWQVFAYGFSKGFSAANHLPIYLRRIAEASGYKDLLLHRWLREYQNDSVVRQQFNEWTIENDISDRVVFLEHHATHALGAYIFSPFERALVFTCDGRGDFLSATVRSFSETGEQTVLAEIPTFDSLGYFYGRVCEVLGFKSNRHEGKVTGLAAFGAHSTMVEELERIFQFKEGVYSIESGKVFAPFYSEHLDELSSLSVKYSREDVSFAVQEVLERVMCRHVQYYASKANVNCICLAGGVFSNVKLNQRIAQLPGVERLFVLPFMGDEGLPLQAAAAAMFEHRRQRPTLDTLYLGLRAGNGDLGPFAKRIVRCFNEAKVAKELSQGKIVGVCRGRSEYGNRALGNRSLLANPSMDWIGNELARRLKRDRFMPLAPILRIERAAELLDNFSESDPSSSHMSRSYAASNYLIQSAPAACHIDGTVRPQVLREKDNPWLYRLLLRFEEITTVPCLINTSFNSHEEPIVDSVEDAIRSLDQGCCDILVLDNDQCIREL